jgi:hypothetical protein
MTPLEIAVEQNEYRLILVKSGSYAIWTDRRGNNIRLPRSTVPRWERQAEQLQKSIEATWRAHGVILDFLPCGKSSSPCVVVEVQRLDIPNGLTTTSIDEMSAEEMTSEERETVRSMLACETGGRGPFSRIGWCGEAIEWLRDTVGRDVMFTEEIRQYNAGGGFVLVRFATQDGRAYWLKATGQRNVHEFHITRQLAELCPEFLPRRIAERVDWNAWLMEDFGKPLDSWTFPALEQAVLTMAALQKRTLGRTHELLVAGAVDRSTDILRSHLPELFEYLNEAMAKQSSTKVSRIEKRRLRQMATILQDACSRMEDLGIPDTLTHNDINSGNILFRGDHCVFTDWCEAGVGNPFLTFQHLCRLQSGNSEDCNPRLYEACKRCWLDCLTTSQFDQAFALTPLLAILSYLYGRGTWLRSGLRHEPHVESYARSLARHMDRAADNSRLLEVLCL